MKSRRIPILVMASAGAIVLMCGCQPDRKITRVDPEEVIDVAPQWNDVDSRQVADQMVADSLTFRWYEEFHADEGRKPILVVGPVRNLTRDYIDTELFTKDVERAYIRAGEVTVVAMAGPERQALFDEIIEQQEFVSVESAKRIGNATGADFMLMGRIGSIVQTSLDGKRSIRYYKTDLEIINLESTEKVWSAGQEVKKDVVRQGHAP